MAHHKAIMVLLITVLLRVATAPWVIAILVLRDVLLMALLWAAAIMANLLKAVGAVLLRVHRKAVGVAHRKADHRRVAMALKTEAMAL